MKAGSVIVDLAAQNHGNCEYTVANQVTTTENGAVHWLYRPSGLFTDAVFPAIRDQPR